MKCPKCDYDLETTESKKSEEPGEFFALKTLFEQEETIRVFGFGIENYIIRNDQYVRKAGK